MLAAVYKSLKKDETYLFVKQRDDFSEVPEALLQTFGAPQFVMLIDLAKRRSLGGADLAKVMQELQQRSFYLQLPPPKQNLHEQWRVERGLPAKGNTI